MIATIVGRVAVDAGSADSERHESVRQRRVVLTSRCWRQLHLEATAYQGATEAKEPFSGEITL